MNKLFSSTAQRFVILLAFTGLLSACDRILTPDFETDIQELGSGNYTLDPDHATILFKINLLGFSSFIGRFNDFDAVLDFDPEHIGNSSLEVIVDTASIDINNPEFAEELRGASWFNTEAFPQAVFRTTSLIAQHDNNFTFARDPTLLGTTAPIQIEVDFHGGGRNFLTRKNTLGFSAKVEFQRSVFGLDNLVPFGVGDDIELEIHVEFQEAS